MLPEHLGGHSNKTNVDNNLLDYFIKKYDIKTMIDIGCGPGGMVDLAIRKGIKSIGIDGDFTLNLPEDRFLIFDYTLGIPTLPENFKQVDLIWSVEFLEHIKEEYMSNYMDTFKKGKYICCTAADPSQINKYHFNLKEKDYWIEKFESYGFKYSVEETEKIKEISTMNMHNIKKSWIKVNGMFFVNENLA